MKKPGYIFVDDGSPEASDYDNNYVGYDPEESGSYERAVEEAKSRRSIATTPAARSEFRARCSISGVTPGKSSPSTAGGMKRNGISAFWRGVLNAVKCLGNRVRRLGGGRKGKSCDGALLPPPRSKRISNIGLIFP